MSHFSGLRDEVAEWVTFAQKIRSRCILQTPHFLLLVALSAIVGCDGSEFELVPVSGLVTLDESPLEDAQVTFTSIGSGVGTTSVGHTDSEGRYKLSTMKEGYHGATLGRHRVTVTTVKIPPDADEQTTIPPEIVPMRYRDGSFSIEVTDDGTDAADIAINTSKKKSKRGRR